MAKKEEDEGDKKLLELAKIAFESRGFKIHKSRGKNKSSFVIAIDIKTGKKFKINMELLRNV